jgi:hypothetical protein
MRVGEVGHHELCETMKVVGYKCVKKSENGTNVQKRVRRVRPRRKSEKGIDRATPYE